MDRESAYDVVEVETDGVGSAAEAEDEDLVDGVSDDCVHLSLFRQRRKYVTHSLPDYFCFSRNSVSFNPSLYL